MFAIQFKVKIFSDKDPNGPSLPLGTISWHHMLAEMHDRSDQDELSKKSLLTADAR